MVGNLTPNLLERLILKLELVTFRFWWKTLIIAQRLPFYQTYEEKIVLDLLIFQRYKFQNINTIKGY